MSQTRYTNFKDLRSSFANNSKDSGILPYGLYRGFDYDASSAGSTLVLSHTINGYDSVDSTGSTVINQGVIRSRQGVYVVESAPVSIAGITGNSGSADPRIDIIVCSHLYVATAGGVVAGYTQIVGTPDPVPVAPALTDNTTQVIIGYIYWPAHAANINDAGVIYTKVDAPVMSNNSNYALLDKIQTITGRKQINFQTTPYAVATLNLISGTSYALVATVDANVFYLANVSADYIDVAFVSMPYNSAGAMITVVTDQKLRLVSTVGSAGVNNHTPGLYQRVEAGETFDLYTSTYGFVGTPNTPNILRADVVRRSTTTKLFSRLLGNKGTGSYVSRQLTLDNAGNFSEVTLSFATVTGNSGINVITGTSSYWDGLNSPTKAGQLLHLRLVDNSGYNHGCLFVTGGAISGAFKPIVFADGSTRKYIGQGGVGYVTLIEDETQFVILDNYAATNTWTAPTYVNSFRDDGINPIRFKYDENTNTVTIKGVCSNSSGVVASSVDFPICTLPVQMRPTETRIFQTGDVGMFSNGVGFIRITTTGVVSIAGDIVPSASNGTLVEIKMSI